jgi:hypothetical protein
LLFWLLGCISRENWGCIKRQYTQNRGSKHRGLLRVRLQRNKSLLLLLRQLLLETVSYIRMSDLFKCLVRRVRIVISARIGRICRVNGVSCDLRAIQLDEGGHGNVVDLPAEG